MTIDKSLPNKLKKHINLDFRAQSLKQLKSLTPSKIEIFDNEPIPQNYTIIFRSDEKTSQIVKQLQTQLQFISKKQYFYPSKQLHLTLLGNIDINIHKQKIIEALGKNLKSLTNINFILYGLGGNQHCSSISAYPTFNIALLRNMLRNEIRSKGDDYSSHLTKYEEVGWINYLRYLESPNQEILKFLIDKQNTFFGLFKPNSVELCANTSKVLDPPQTKLIWKSNLF